MVMSIQVYPFHSVCSFNTHCDVVVRLQMSEFHEKLSGISYLSFRLLIVFIYLEFNDDFPMVLLSWMIFIMLLCSCSRYSLLQRLAVSFVHFALLGNERYFQMNELLRI